ncbi:hypothetical protein NE865_09905 [Phthorimaea operculella]|nr:hypothetical protein NE865_09905 [Phthorimaea operculella]
MTCGENARVSPPRYTSRYPMTSPPSPSVTPREEIFEQIQRRSRTICIRPRWARRLSSPRLPDLGNCLSGRKRPSSVLGPSAFVLLSPRLPDLGNCLCDRKRPSAVLGPSAFVFTRCIDHRHPGCQTWETACATGRDPAPFSDHLHSSSLGASAIVTPAARPGKLLVRQEEVNDKLLLIQTYIDIPMLEISEQTQRRSRTICIRLRWAPRPSSPRLPDLGNYLCDKKRPGSVLGPSAFVFAGCISHRYPGCQTWETARQAGGAPFSDHLHSSSLGASAIVTPAARPGKLLVRQEEVEAMIAALRLIAGVAREDHAACANICENLQWDAVNVMFGLICCHIPIQLKAELTLTLAALGGTASTAGRVWAGLEAAQLVTTSKDKRALNMELHEVECRMEEYPLSRAFLTLLMSLCTAAPLPRALGAGQRAPGLDPYVEHVLNRLALPAPHRPYATPSEKWQMLSLCFRLFAHWLEHYEPSAADFPATGREPDTNPPPGFRLMLQLHTKSELLRLMLACLDECHEMLDRPAFPGKEYVEQCLISILQMLERALSLERALVASATEAGRSVLIVGLSKLILGKICAETYLQFVITGIRGAMFDQHPTNAETRAVVGTRVSSERYGGRPICADSGTVQTHTCILQMLERALSLERELVASATEAGRSVLIVGLSKLILGKFVLDQHPTNALVVSATEAGRSVLIVGLSKLILVASATEAGRSVLIVGLSKLILGKIVLDQHPTNAALVASATEAGRSVLIVGLSKLILGKIVLDQHPTNAALVASATEAGRSVLIVGLSKLILGKIVLDQHPTNAALVASATEAGRSVLIVGLSKLILGKIVLDQHPTNVGTRVSSERYGGRQICSDSGTVKNSYLVRLCLISILQMLERALVASATEAGRSVLIVGLSKLILGKIVLDQHPQMLDRALVASATEAGRSVLIVDCPNSYLVRLCLISILQMLERELVASATEAGRSVLIVGLSKLILGKIVLDQHPQMLDRALVASATEAGRSVLIVGLSKLILAPEGPENNDRLVTCCKVLQHGPSQPTIAAKAVALLCRALQSPAAARHLLPAVTYRHAVAAEIRHGFVECLEAEEYGEEDEVAAIRQTKEGIVMLLQQVLPTAPPNLAHFLLGYQLSEDVSRSQLNEPGAAGFPRTCLHSILDILDQHISGQNNADREANNLVESCYRLLYWLCARPNTSAPVLRLLRSRDYFLSRHVKATVNLETASVVTLSARSWLLRACACEAGAAAASRQHAALSAMLTALTHTQHHPTQEWEWCLLRRTLENLPVSVEAAAEPRWELFNSHQLRQAIASCDLPTVSVEAAAETSHSILRPAHKYAFRYVFGLRRTLENLPVSVEADQLAPTETSYSILRLAYRTLENLPVSVEAAAEPRWELFNSHQLRQAIASCDLPTVSVEAAAEPRWELFNSHQLRQAIASCDLPTGMPSDMSLFFEEPLRIYQTLENLPVSVEAAEPRWELFNSHQLRQAIASCDLPTVSVEAAAEPRWELFNSHQLRQAIASCDLPTVSVEAAAEPRWELFNSHQLRQAIASCDLPTGLGGKRISVSRVHALLARELAALNATAPQRNLVVMEIQKVLDYVTDVNRQRNLAATLTHYYDSWLQNHNNMFLII